LRKPCSILILGPLLATSALALAQARNPALGEPPPAPQPPIATTTGAEGLDIGPGGFSLRSPDGDYRLNVRGYVQIDERLYVDSAAVAPTTFLVRRARPIFDAVVARWFGFRIMPDFGGGQAVIYDAYVEVRTRPEIVLTVGKFRPPIGFERLQSASRTTFVEYGPPSNLVPYRDLGVQLSGELGKGVLLYAAGIFNGAGDFGLSDGDNSDDKDVAGRILLRPFVRLSGAALSALSLGLSASFGRQTGTPAAPNLPSYRTLSEQVFFTFVSDGTAAGTAVAAGDRLRFSPHGVWYWGRLGLLGEYVRETQRVSRGVDVADLNFWAWQVALSCVLFGGQPSWEGVQPLASSPARNPFVALEIAARYGEHHNDLAAFQLGFADPWKSAQVMRAGGTVVNLYLSRGFKVSADLELAQFVGGGTPKRGDETSLLLRMQVGF